MAQQFFMPILVLLVVALLCSDQREAKKRMATEY
jgi:hypothetical protein